MEFIERVMGKYAVPEFKNVVTEMLEVFDTHGYIEHIQDIEYLESIDGNVESQFLVDSVMGCVSRHARDLLLKLFVVVDKDLSIFKLKELFFILENIEKSFESETICYMVNTELTPKDQLIEWSNFLMPEKTDFIAEHVVDVRQNLIDNIVGIHELRVPVEPETTDEIVKSKIKQLKILKHEYNVQNLLVYDIVSEKGFKELYAFEELINYKPEFLPSLFDKPNLLAIELIGLAILVEGDPKALSDTATKLADYLIKDVNVTMRVSDAINKFMRDKGNLC